MTRTLLSLALCVEQDLVPVGSYGRLSDDKVGRAIGRVGVSADSQHDDAHDVATRRRWGVVREYTDNDASAFQDDVIRDEFEEMLVDLASGMIRGIVCYNLDRFLRRPDDLERVIKIYKKLAKQGRPAVFASAQGDIDLSTDEGQTMARYMTVGNNAQSAATARRVSRGHLRAAKSGAPAQMRGFGFGADRVTHDPVEARLIRQGADMLLKGQPLADVVRAWNAAGAPTVFGNEWLHTTVRNVFRAPRLAGLRVHQGKVMLNEHGEEVKGCWKPILDRATWDAVQDVFASNAAKQTPASNHYVLSGICVCGKCGRRMYAQANTRWSETTSIRMWGRAQNSVATAKGQPELFKVGERGSLSPKLIAAYRSAHPDGAKSEQAFVYTCKPVGAGRGSCGSNSIGGVRTDQLISRLMEQRLASRLAPSVAPVFERQAELDVAKEQIAELMEAYRVQAMPGSVVFPQVAQLQAIVDTLSVEQQATARAAARARRAVESTPQDWRAASVDQKRTMLRLELSAVVIRPSVSQGGVFDRSRVLPQWLAPAG